MKRRGFPRIVGFSSLCRSPARRSRRERFIGSSTDHRARSGGRFGQALPGPERVRDGHHGAAAGGRVEHGDDEGCERAAAPQKWRAIDGATGSP